MSSTTQIIIVATIIFNLVYFFIDLFITERYGKRASAIFGLVIAATWFVVLAVAYDGMSTWLWVVLGSWLLHTYLCVKDLVSESART